MNSRSYHSTCMRMLLTVYGENDEGIDGTCPTELMHAFWHGLIPYIVKVLIGSFSTVDKYKLNMLVDHILYQFGLVSCQNVQE